MLLVRSYHDNLDNVAERLQWPLAKVQASANYANAFPREIDEALAENDTMGESALKRMLPRTVVFNAGKAAKR